MKLTHAHSNGSINLKLQNLPLSTKTIEDYFFKFKPPRAKHLFKSPTTTLNVSV